MLCHRTSREVVDTVCGMVIKGDKAGGDDAVTCPLKVLPGIHGCMLLLLGPTVGLLLGVIAVLIMVILVSVNLLALVIFTTFHNIWICM